MKKKIAAFCAALGLSVAVFSGCGSERGIVSIEKTSSVGLTDVYTITYSDGSQGTFSVTNGKDGSVTAEDAYETYKRLYGEDISYDEFLQKYLLSDDSGITKAVNSSLLTSLKVACEFDIKTLTGGGILGRPTYTERPVIQQGSAVIYKIEEDYTYLVTNYHVIYNSEALGSKECKRVHAYIYGSEQTPYLDSATNEYVYGDYAIECEYIGGEISYDIALLRLKTDDIKKRNSDICAVELEENYFVGDTVYSVGNTEGLGISVNSGVISVDSEFITLKIDGTARSYRSIRMDAAIHEGNSGGGLFNSDGKLIGINHAGSSETSSMNYAIPASIVKGVADSVLYYYSGNGAVGIKKPVLGVTLQGVNSRFIYDKQSGLGKIKEDISVSSVTENSVAEALKIKEGDIILSITVNGKETSLLRYYELGDILLSVRSGDKIKLKYSRNGAASETEEFKVNENNLVEVE